MAFIKSGPEKQMTPPQPESPQKPELITTSVPLVFIKKKEDGKIVYHGFVPGIVIKDIISEDIEECKEKLKNIIIEKLKTKVQLSSPMPFFPSNDEIVKDFDNVCLIKRIKFMYKSYKTF